MTTPLESGPDIAFGEGETEDNRLSFMDFLAPPLDYGH
jgi:hypothetical protein